MKPNLLKRIILILEATLVFLMIRVASPYPTYAQMTRAESDAASYKGHVKTIPCRHLFDITEIGGKRFNQPSSVNTYDDRVIILDGVNGRVAVFNADGKPIFQFGRIGSGPGEFKSPLGLTIDSKGRIYVADSGNHRVQIFDPNGTLLKVLKLREDKFGFPADPTDLVINEKDGKILIVDNDNHRILVYSVDGKFVKEIGEVGFENGQFRYPYSIALDTEGFYYVVDVLNTRVQVFNPDYTFARNIGEWGIEKGQFFRPQAIAIDKKGRVFVTESYQKIGVIQAFSKDGTFLAIIGDKAKKKLSFSVPTDICFDNRGRVYICEMYDSRISVYQIEE